MIHLCHFELDHRIKLWNHVPDWIISLTQWIRPAAAFMALWVRLGSQFIGQYWRPNAAFMTLWVSSNCQYMTQWVSISKHQFLTQWVRPGTAFMTTQIRRGTRWAIYHTISETRWSSWHHVCDTESKTYRTIYDIMSETRWSFYYTIISIFCSSICWFWLPVWHLQTLLIENNSKITYIICGSMSDTTYSNYDTMSETRSSMCMTPWVRADAPFIPTMSQTTRTLTRIMNVTRYWMHDPFITVLSERRRCIDGILNKIICSIYDTIILTMRSIYDTMYETSWSANETIS
jgi:hypothetical protein